MKKITTIEETKEFAFSKHDRPSESQRYGNAPYSKHLQDVEDQVEKYSYYLPADKVTKMKQAAYLHDIVEDTEITPDDLVEIFDIEIATWVFNVSNERGFSRKEKNFKTYPKIWTCDFSIYLKLCDRIANTTNSKIHKVELFEMYKKEYPVFKYALKVRGLYPDMWAKLDELYYS